MFRTAAASLSLHWQSDTSQHGFSSIFTRYRKVNTELDPCGLDLTGPGVLISSRIHRPSPVSRLPPEILRMVFLECSADASCHQTRSGHKPCHGWIAITHVCSIWRQIALEYPELWTSICHTVAPNEGWLLAFFDRSCRKLLDVEIDENWYGETRERLLSSLPRIRSLTLANGMYLEDFPLATSAPMLEQFRITQELEYRKSGPSEIPDDLFARYAPRLRALQLPSGYELSTTSPLLPRLRHLSLEHLHWSIPSWIDLLRRASVLETVNLSLADECSDCKFAHEDHSDDMYQDITSVALPNLRLLTISSGCPYELDVFLHKISFNPERTTFIRPYIVASGLGDEDDHLVDMLSGLDDHRHRPQIEPHEYLSISLGAGSTEQSIDYRGWRTENLEKTWYLTTHAPGIRPTVRFSRSFTDLDEAPSHETSRYAPFTALSSMCERLPTQNVLALWLSMSTEGVKDDEEKAYNSLSGWRSFFDHFEGVEILRVSGPDGLPEFLSALTRLSIPSPSGSDDDDDNPFLVPQHHLSLFLPRLKEIVVGDLDSDTGTLVGRKCAKATCRSLFRFLRQRYLSNATLEGLHISSGLCSLICNSDETMEMLSYYVEDAVSCLECGRSWHGTKNLGMSFFNAISTHLLCFPAHVFPSGSHDRKIEIFVWFPDGRPRTVRVDPELLVSRFLDRLHEGLEFPLER